MRRRTKNILLIWILISALVSVAEVSSMRKNGDGRYPVPPQASQNDASPLLGREGPFGESSYPKEGEAVLFSGDPQDLNTGDSTSEISGALTLVAVRDPVDYFEGRGVQNLEIDLEGEEWVALFIDALGCPIAGDEPFLTGDDTEQWRHRYKRKFQATMERYPMLGRIWGIYAYVSYLPEEVEELRKECERVRASTLNEKARAGLGKLLVACNKSSRLGLGLLLIPD